MKKKIDLYATESVQQGIRNQFGYIFKEKQYPGIPEISLHTIENKPFAIEGVTFTPILVKHMHLDVFGFRIGNFTYITDANAISAEEKKKIAGSEILVLPQAHTVPSFFRASECECPPSIEIIPVREFTVTGRLLLILFPLPSWPV